jgi:hypothetical protein
LPQYLIGAFRDGDYWPSYALRRTIETDAWRLLVRQLAPSFA